MEAFWQQFIALSKMAYAETKLHCFLMHSRFIRNSFWKNSRKLTEQQVTGISVDRNEGVHVKCCCVTYVCISCMGMERETYL